MLVLSLLGESESYGYELVTRLRDAGLEGISPGTVYPVLTRLEREGTLSSRLQASTAGPARKYYVVTDQGRTRHDDALAAWHQLAAVVHVITVPEGART